MKPNLAALAVALSLGVVVGFLVGRDETSMPHPTAPTDPAETVSPQVREYLRSLPDPATLPAWPAPDDVVGWKRAWQAGEAESEPAVKATLERYRPTVEERKLGGVPVLSVKPQGWKDNGKVLIHLHGGAYTFYSARSRLTSSVPAAHVTGLLVVSVDYTVAPAGKWRKVTDQVLAVYGALRQEGRRPKDVAIYGESAGGGMAAGSVLKMRDQGLPMPAAVVLWSPWADVTNTGDSAITLRQFDPYYRYEKDLKHAADAYADPADQKHPYVSPVYGDYAKGFPPTLIQGGTRELFLSHFVRQYRAIDGAGGLAVLDLYDGMPHVFQMRRQLADAPQTQAAMKKMAAFLAQHLKD